MELQSRLKYLRELTGVGPDGKVLKPASPKESRDSSWAGVSPEGLDPEETPLDEGDLGGPEPEDDDFAGDPALRRRLARLRNPRKGGGAAGKPRVRKLRQLAELVPGELRETPYGSIFVAVQTFAPDHLHGLHPLGAARKLDPERLVVLHRKHELRSLNLEEALFLDLETTGLSGGAGTCAFMVGMGHYHQGNFVVEQAFLEDFAQEPALLWLVAQRIARARALVSFNGKCFDVPMLATRFVLSRMQVDILGLPHLDLLFPARRVWKGRFPDCRLGTLEERVLGVPRDLDVPGEEIPERYFRYLRNRDPGPLVPVFFHNLLDILTLATLPVHLAGLLDHPEPDPEDLPALGRIYHAHGDLESAERLFAQVLEGSGGEAERCQVMLNLARIYKGQDRQVEAERLWLALIEEPEFHLEPYEELAKLYEHETREPARALEVVDLALKRLPSYPEKPREALEHRRERLARKAKRGVSGTDY